jgi:mono/diheme cytochrome c family protein
MDISHSRVPALSEKSFLFQLEVGENQCRIFHYSLDVCYFLWTSARLLGRSSLPIMKIQYSILLLISIVLPIGSCHTVSEEEPGISFDTYKVADGFEIQLVASEPLIEAPVAIDFDNQGRIWVVEMRGYMPNLAGTGEDQPNGRISILDSFDKDGVAKHSKVFLDSLVLPRAIAHVYGGLLYAAPPSLWFVEINNDKPGKRTLVDSSYTNGGNVETQPNGLMMNIDNWLYSANSNFRYQLKDGKWKKEPTSLRGQWGISKDNVGRLYYNSNEIQIAGDYVLPNTMIGNPYLKPTAAIDKLLTENQRVYPLHPTTVNRGGETGILNKDSLLVKVTAACGPLIYRGDQFPDEYKLNAFVCEPQANLVKRNILTFNALKTTAVQAWNDREFIASTDEGFRPVNLLNAPDGAIYVVDMHRGIMQHRAYATPYYRNGISRKNLDTLVTTGRILRVKNKNNNLTSKPNLVNATENALVELLSSPNGWIRDRAQQLLIFRQQKSIIPQVEALLLIGKNPIAAIHALYVLEGLNALSFNLLEKVASASDPMLSSHALLLLQGYNTSEHTKSMETLAMNLMARNDTVVNLYLASSLGAWATASRETFLPMLAKLSQLYPDNAVFQEAVVSSLKNMETEFQSIVNKSGNALLNNLLRQTITNKHNGKKNSIFVKTSVSMDARTNGLVIFRSTCGTCHGADGEGIANIAPPLRGSEYLEGPSERLAMILLNGLTGPLHINGKLYKFNGSMPNFGNNYNDQQIADVIGYLHNSFVAKPPKRIRAERIKTLRTKHSGTLTENDLNKMADLAE